MMRLRALKMIEFLDNDWSHQISSIKMIHRQIKLCEWSELVLYCKADHMTFFEYNSSQMIIIFAIILSLIHDFRILSTMSNYISWHLINFVFIDRFLFINRFNQFSWKSRYFCNSRIKLFSNRERLAKSYSTYSTSSVLTLVFFLKDYVFIISSLH
jgi:hypothetical protein